MRRFSPRFEKANFVMHVNCNFWRRLEIFENLSHSWPIKTRLRRACSTNSWSRQLYWSILYNIYYYQQLFFNNTVFVDTGLSSTSTSSIENLYCSSLVLHLILYDRDSIVEESLMRSHMATAQFFPFFHKTRRFPFPLVASIVSSGTSSLNASG